MIQNASANKITPERKISQRRSFLLPLIFLFLISITILSYWQVKDFEFLNFDDKPYVSMNPHVKQLAAANIKWAFTSNEQSNWHPLTWITYMFVSQLFGPNPAVYHLTNIMFHLLNVLLLFWILYRMTGGLFKSIFVAALLAIHPLHVESVAWISELKDVLSAFFWMLTILAYLGYVKNPSSRRYIIAVLFFALGIMAKPMIITLPFVLLLLDYWPLKRMTSRSSFGNLLFEKIPFFLLCLISARLTIWAQSSHESLIEIKEWPFSNRLQNAAVAYIKYIMKMIWPNPLAHFILGHMSLQFGKY